MMSVVQLRFATLGVDYIRRSGPCSGAAHGPLAVNTPCVFEIKARLCRSLKFDPGPGVSLQ